MSDSLLAAIALSFGNCRRCRFPSRLLHYTCVQWGAVKGGAYFVSTNRPFDYIICCCPTLFKSSLLCCVALLRRADWLRQQQSTTAQRVDVCSSVECKILYGVVWLRVVLLQRCLVDLFFSMEAACTHCTMRSNSYDIWDIDHWLPIWSPAQATWYRATDHQHGVVISIKHSHFRVFLEFTSISITFPAIDVLFYSWLCYIRINK